MSHNEQQYEQKNEQQYVTLEMKILLDKRTAIDARWQQTREEMAAARKQPANQMLIANLVAERLALQRRDQEIVEELTRMGFSYETHKPIPDQSTKEVTKD